MPRFREPAEEVELGGEIPVAEDDLVQGVRRLRYRDAGLDLVETVRVTETATSTPDNDVESSSLVIHPKRFDEWQRLRSDGNRLVEPAGQHVETALVH